MRKLVYLGFFILKTNYDDLGKSIKCTVSKGHFRFSLIIDMLYCSLRYGSSFVDYFNFNFYNKSHEERNAYASMGIMYTFHNKINHRDYIDKVDNKKSFFVNFEKFCNRPFLFKRSQIDEAINVFSQKGGKKIVVKDPGSTAGKGVRIFDVTQKGKETFIGDVTIQEFCKSHFAENESLYFEDFIQQHDEINAISPTGVNTIRIITLINDDGEVEIIGSVFRISVNCPIDNFSAGNLAAEIDKSTGIVITGGIRKRSSCDKYHVLHPVTGMLIKDFKVPFWSDIMVMVKQAALVVPEVRSVGWDIAVTGNGPLIIEGNSKWNKDTWQIPAGRGKLHLIKQYL